jgi:spermidine/putrescine transport system substrate-binding protein
VPRVMDRARWAWAFVAVLAACVALGCGSSGSGEEEGAEAASSKATAEEELGGTIRVSNWDNYLPPDVVKAFEKETGVKVDMAVHATNEEIVGKLEAASGSGFDVVFISGPFVEMLEKRGWLAELDHAGLPNIENLPDEATDLPYDPGNTHSIPYSWSATGICYREDKLKETPDSWQDLLDPPAEARGKVTLIGTDRWLMLPALKVLGYSVNTTDPQELEEAKELLIKAKETMLAFDDATFHDKLAAGEAYISEAWDGWCNYGTDKNPNVKFVVPKEGSDLSVDAMVILDSSENKSAALAFIDYVLRPESATAAAEGVYYKMVNEPGMAAVDPKLLKKFPNLNDTPAELVEGETQRDLGEGTKLWSEVVGEIKN